MNNKTNKDLIEVLLKANTLRRELDEFLYDIESFLDEVLTSKEKEILCANYRDRVPLCNISEKRDESAEELAGLVKGALEKISQKLNDTSSGDVYTISSRNFMGFYRELHENSWPRFSVAGVKKIPQTGWAGLLDD